MLSNSLAPFGGMVAEPIVQAILRFVLDRSFKRHLRKKTNIDKERAKLEEEKPRDPIVGKEDPDRDAEFIDQDKAPEDYEGGDDHEDAGFDEEGAKDPNTLGAHGDVEEVDPDECETKKVF